MTAKLSQMAGASTMLTGQLSNRSEARHVPKLQSQAASRSHLGGHCEKELETYPLNYVLMLNKIERLSVVLWCSVVV